MGLRDEHHLRGFENRVLGELCSSPDVSTTINFRRMKWAAHVAVYGRYEKCGCKTCGEETAMEI
jgi:hypothetical protein